MKRILAKIFLVSIAAICIQFSSQAQIYVKVRPVETVVVNRPPAPSPRHVWVEGDWVWRGGQYVHDPGRWVVPAYRGAAWVPGHWRSTRRGWAWVPGHWRRRR